MGREFVGEFADVAHTRRGDHRADINGERQPGHGQRLGDERADADGDNQLEHSSRVHAGVALVLDFFLHQQAVVLGHNGVQQLAALNEQTARRAAHDAARNQAVGGRRRAERGRARNAEVLEHGAERARRAVAADHRDGTGAQTDQRRDAQQIRQPDGEEVLAQNQRNDQPQEEDQRFAAAFQHLEVGLKAYRGEEEHHADFL